MLHHGEEPPPPACTTTSWCWLWLWIKLIRPDQVKKGNILVYWNVRVKFHWIVSMLTAHRQSIVRVSFKNLIFKIWASNFLQLPAIFILSLLKTRILPSTCVITLSYQGVTVYLAQTCKNDQGRCQRLLSLYAKCILTAYVITNKQVFTQPLEINGEVSFCM